MKVITELNTGVILDIADNAENTGSGVKVTKNGGVYFIGFNVDIQDIESVPSNVAPNSHIYDGVSFGENPNYTPPYSAEDDIASLQVENAALSAKVDQLESDNADLLLMLVDKGVL